MQSALEQLQRRALDWRVAVDEIFETPTSVLGFGERDNSRVVLKISRTQGDESDSGNVLRAFGGDGAARVFESDTGAVLLERLDPGDQLVTLVRRGNDEEATRIIAGVIGKLANHTAPSGCPTVGDWGRGLDRYLNSGDRQVPIELVQQASQIYYQLESSQRQMQLLHGDLQHYNVLLDKNRGWVAIDPKGVVGELEYEVGAMLRNPVEQPQFLSAPATIECRLRILVETLQLDYERALEWSFAQAVLSAIWNVEDGDGVKPDNPGLLLAKEISRGFTRIKQI
jgi:streptomycin 6-kinase